MTVSIATLNQVLAEYGKNHVAHQIARQLLDIICAEPSMFSITFQGKVEEIGGDTQAFTREECEREMKRWSEGVDEKMDGYAVTPLYAVSEGAGKVFGALRKQLQDALTSCENWKRNYDSSQSQISQLLQRDSAKESALEERAKELADREKAVELQEKSLHHERELIRNERKIHETTIRDLQIQIAKMGGENGGN
ncbi:MULTISPECIES: hypothetical protein [Enterobacterales]|uniref:hypothetical protein n=1 Tax=Enterobacterales TaxID=91347 RepID=UPI00313B28B9